mmetsp:Transcript_10403/g.15543  ORF Transcript_10403/g.15543 Transcript_10403/m.15543 type:complete len:112 (-) Transcript_10403:21-356(-)
MSEYEVTEVYGEGSEEEEDEPEEPEEPEEQAYQLVTNYKKAETAKLHSKLHELLNSQTQALQESAADLSTFQKIPQYQKRIKTLLKRKKAIEKRRENIMQRLQAALTTINN